jgi:hypothetical protein
MERLTQARQAVNRAAGGGAAPADQRALPR